MDDRIEQLLSAAHESFAEAQYDLGLAYFNGDGIRQDYVEAYFWLTVCSKTKGMFWSPSPDEVAADALVHFANDEEEVINAVLDRVTTWFARHEDPVAGDEWQIGPLTRSKA